MQLQVNICIRGNLTFFSRNIKLARLVLTLQNLCFSKMGNSKFLIGSIQTVLHSIIGEKVVFVGGAVVYSIGMALMAITRHKVAVIILSSTAGIMFTTLSTLPYILVAHYHTSQKFRENTKANDNCVRGIGTDVATIVSVLVLPQSILSFAMGSVVEAVGSNVVVVCSTALFSVCGAIFATQVMYLDK